MLLNFTTSTGVQVFVEVLADVPVNFPAIHVVHPSQEVM
jgi:hypothetical protein